MKLVIIDYKLSNLFSVEQACIRLGYTPVVTSDKAVIESADALILPGVGAFGEAMHNLQELGILDTIKERVLVQKVPFMGVCLGMQLLFTRSEEFGAHEGLGFIKGQVVKFPPSVGKVPQIGWNTIREQGIAWKETPLKSVQDQDFMYFVHSYYVVADEPEVVLCATEYNGLEYCSAVMKDNIFATQFHPEKSGENGLTMYKNWLETIK